MVSIIEPKQIFKICKTVTLFCFVITGTYKKPKNMKVV